jgi:hypothetical protein
LSGAAFLAALFVIDAAKAVSHARASERTITRRSAGAAFRILRPIAFRWGHMSGWLELRTNSGGWPARPPATDRHPIKAPA